MSDILRKEMYLSASVLSYFFILFGLMFFLPGYPILCGPFFVTVGIFQSFQSAREANDIVFSSLLPIAKKDIVKGKYLFACFIEGCALMVMFVAVVLRMTVLSSIAIYRHNALMNANLFALANAFVIFGLFNRIFICEFFKTAYKFARPFVFFIVACSIVILIAETLHHIPGLTNLNAFGFHNIALQFILLIIGIFIYLIMTLLSCKKAIQYFEKIDL